MDLVNGAAIALFNVLLIPLEALGDEFSLVVTSGVFGILALYVFKHISYQKGIKGTKNRIKGHLIEIRIYQDDLVVVARSVVKILMRNFQYLGLNFGPFVPLAIPFVIVASQMVVRYGFDPIPVEEPGRQYLAGQGVTLEVELEPEAVGGLQVILPEGLRALSPLTRTRSDGRAFQEFVATAEGEWDVRLVLADGTEVVKKVYTGEHVPRAMQPERVSSFWSAWLWPAEDTLAGTSITRVAIVYPERELAYMPDGPFGIIITLIVASMAFGFAMLKPLGVQI